MRLLLFYFSLVRKVIINPAFDSGFLSTEDSEAPGNYGLLDQTMALRYFQHLVILKNIFVSLICILYGNIWEDGFGTTFAHSVATRIQLQYSVAALGLPVFIIIFYHLILKVYNESLLYYKRFINSHRTFSHV